MSIKNREKNYIMDEEKKVVLVKALRGIEGSPVVIQSSGYTIDEKAIGESWIKTQFRTIPHKDRSELGDPMMFKPRSLAYAFPWCTVYIVYFLPGCEGIKKAGEALKKVFDEEFGDLQNTLFVGHSKGALLMTSMLEHFDKMANVLLISPTYPTLFGNEQMLLDEIEKTKDWRRFIIKPFIKSIGSRRPVDKDMAPHSDFLEELNIKVLENHNVQLIVANCSKSAKDRTTIIDKAFSTLGTIVGLDRGESGKMGHDGMCCIKDQMKLERYCRNGAIEITGNHQNSFSRSWGLLLTALGKIQEEKE